MRRHVRVALCAGLLLLTLFSPLSSADTVDAINGARSAGCGGRKGLKTPWVENPRLDAATPEATVQGWLDSPHHCANLMSARFTQTGIAYAIDPDSQFGIYWTQVFGTPK